MDGYRSKLINVLSGVQQGCVLGSLLFLMVTSELFSFLENKLIGYADDSTLTAVVPSLQVRVTVAESMIRDLGRISESCNLCGMKWNASETKKTIGHTQRIPSHHHLLLAEVCCISQVTFLILQVIFDPKLNFEKHLRSVSRAASQRLGILRKSWLVLNDRFLLGRCFRRFVLPFLGYCSAV